jgi:hypothetical protein
MNSGRRPRACPEGLKDRTVIDWKSGGRDRRWWCSRSSAKRGTQRRQQRGARIDESWITNVEMQRRGQCNGGRVVKVVKVVKVVSRGEIKVL